MVLGEESAQAFSSRYQLLELVGEGANARVYTADDRTLRRRVVVKILREELAGDEAFRQRFEQEMRAASALNFPRVLPVDDWGLDPRPYVVTEHVSGGSLAGLLAAGHRLSPSQGLAVGLEVARALQNIHRAGSAYRGLTASSIMFDSQARVFVSDIGVAAALAAIRNAEPDSGGGDPASTDADAVHADLQEGDAVAPDSVESEPWGIEVDSWDTEVWDIEAWGLDDAVGLDPTETADGQDVAGSPTESQHTLDDQQQDVSDLALILNEAVTGVRAVPGGKIDRSLPVSILLGPLQTPLERATVADPADRLDAAGLVEEFLRLARLLPRPDPLPIVATEAAAAGDDVAPLTSAPATLAGHEARVFSPTPRLSAIPLDDVLRRRWPGLVLAVALVLGGGVAGVWAWIDSRPETNPVPELAGRSRAAAVSTVAELGWEVEEILVREPGSRRGRVVRTEPAAGSELGDGATIDLFVSIGGPLVPLDFDLYGHTVLDATELLEQRGLDVDGEAPVNDEVVPPGLVVGLDVADGVYEVEPGSAVGLRVSAGPADRTVPDLPAERTPISAVEALFAARLEPREVTEFSADVPEGEVIGFRPASGETLEADSLVEIRVSLGPLPREPEEPGDADEPGEASQG